ncbi:hypothetical protein CROQUDRAFT_135694 [Cronartium quercuum f. sp. fusiforme G11]|uniref:histone acetyltransferase n=1 Tax=Cronartium quercuum f. sp. fusiforme G11 TaxID=708437 RepID=A0A9P6NDX0_9BASI|nr:hypothetical protein CROQUDRAFT_135694 [Cronartium quercuum f. sp. fusiforme G11]
MAQRLDENEPRKAEVLGIRPKVIRRSRFNKINKEDKEIITTEEKDEDQIEFYLHWVGYNKRLDEWVIGSRVCINQPIEWPIINQSNSNHNSMPINLTNGKQSRKSTLKKESINSGKLRKVAIKNAQKKRRQTSIEINTVDDHSSQPMIIDSESAVSDEEEDEEEEEEEEDEEIEEVESEQASFSKEDEIEKLRTSGSMTQSNHEISRVKNLNLIQIGKHEIEAWYFSPYPIEFFNLPILYICEFCLSFYKSEYQIFRHRKKCKVLHPPGNEIYRNEDLHFFEIDGRRQKTWCRNLSLLSKCFLDHKTLYYDVDPFLFYIMCKRDSNGLHLIGYFSKEKESLENYNVACILTLPQYQRFGFGKLLIEFSYELSKKELKLGSPEKPLSDLGLLSYRAYWEETIIDLILDNLSKGLDISIDEISQRTAIVHSDVMHVCQTLQILKYHDKQHVICLSDAIIERHERNQKKKRKRIQPSRLNWKPPVFSRAQLQFGF